MTKRVSICAFLAVLMSAALMSAQQGTAEVRGRVSDAQSAVLAGVHITVRNQDTGMFRETVTGEDGTYFVSGDVPGQYEIVAEGEGIQEIQPKRRAPGDREDDDARCSAGGWRP